MTAHAAQVCAELGLPHLVLARPAWDPAGAVRVASDVEAAQVVANQHYSRVFLTTGRSGVAPFTSSQAWFLIRVVTPPDATVMPCNHEVLLSRGPYGYADECALLRDKRIDVLVTKNSGGELTEAKLKAAADLGVALVMIDRPPLPVGVNVVSTVAEAADWVQAQVG
jgi:precorrin-6A/cobalt-precorrin-6A reductase